VPFSRRATSLSAFFLVCSASLTTAQRRVRFPHPRIRTVRSSLSAEMTNGGLGCPQTRMRRVVGVSERRAGRRARGPARDATLFGARTHRGEGSVWVSSHHMCRAPAADDLRAHRHGRLMPCNHICYSLRLFCPFMHMFSSDKSSLAATGVDAPALCSCDRSLPRPQPRRAQRPCADRDLLARRSGQTLFGVCAVPSADTSPRG
jgi:hypothetical protein